MFVVHVCVSKQHLRAINLQLVALKFKPPYPEKKAAILSKLTREKNTALTNTHNNYEYNTGITT